jgi:Flp pilus assembly protein TadD
MAHPGFDTLLADADSFARLGEWERTFDALSQAARLDPQHAGVLTGLGTSLLQRNRLAEALPYFEQAALAAPDSPEAHNNLGVAYLLAGKVAEAEAALRQALVADEAHAPAWKNLALLCLRNDRAVEGVSVLAALVQSRPDDSEALMMLADCYAQGGEAESARQLYSRVLALEPRHTEARAALARLNPAARLARPEHVHKLAALKSRNAQPEAAIHTIAFYGPNEVSDGVRLGVPAEGLARLGWRVKVDTVVADADLRDCETFVFARPQLNRALMEGMARVKRAGKRLIVDLDDDFHQLPDDHPGYDHVGPGNTERLRALEDALALADVLVTATPALAERCRRFAKRVEVIPNGWSRANTLWEKPAPRRATFNVGWAGTPTHRADLALIKFDVLRFMRDFPRAQLVIGGDPGVWEMFAQLPEERRLFLPLVPFDDYPYLLAHFDVLLAPLRDNAFNQAKSDIKLVEAGVRRIPWVASPRAAYCEWGAGGLLAEKPGEWYTALSRLASDVLLCTDLGNMGRARAETREAALIAQRWQAVLG